MDQIAAMRIPAWEVGGAGVFGEAEDVASLLSSALLGPEALENFRALAERLAPATTFGPLRRRDHYVIAEAAEHLGVTFRALRFYEQAGLVCPRRVGAKRLYTHDDVVRLRVIVTLREFEVPLPAIKALLIRAECEDAASVSAALDELVSAVAVATRSRIGELERIGARIETVLRRSGDQA